MGFTRGLTYALRAETERSFSEGVPSPKRRINGSIAYHPSCTAASASHRSERVLTAKPRLHAAADSSQASASSPSSILGNVVTHRQPADASLMSERQSSTSISGYSM